MESRQGMEIADEYCLFNRDIWVGKTSVTRAIESIESGIEIIRHSDVLKSYYKNV